MPSAAPGRWWSGRAISEVYPQLGAEGAYVEPEEIDASSLDVAFVAYGHGESAEAVRGLLEAGARLVVDLSADFRLSDVGVYEEWYGEHAAPGLLEEAHYGLPEVFGAPEGRLVANPGCYPTAAILALAPVVRRVGVRSVTINALSGVSGAGAKPSVKTHFVTVNESVSPYGISCSAAHTRRWNGVPRGASGRSKSVRAPAKYSASCRAAAANGSASSSRTPNVSGAGRCRCSCR